MATREPVLEELSKPSDGGGGLSVGNREELLSASSSISLDVFNHDDIGRLVGCVVVRGSRREGGKGEVCSTCLQISFMHVCGWCVCVYV